MHTLSHKAGLLAGLSAISLSVFGQQLPASLITDWSVAGVQHTIPVYDTIDVAALGLFTDGQTPNDDKINSLLASFQNSPTLFSFPAGDYLFKKPITLGSGQILKGASAAETRFIFDLTTENHLINVTGQPGTDTVWVTADVVKDSTRINVSETGIFQSGDFIKIASEDEALVTSSWARYSTGQICQIIEVADDYIVLKNQVRKTVLLTAAPRVVRLEPVEYTGIECLTLERKDSTVSQTGNILFDHAANCWVKGVASVNCNFSHITIQNSTQISVSGSFFKDAFNYGGGGKGYGVVLQFNTGNCLIENNIFQHLRHSILLQAGANGNVISYNYSTQPFWTGTNLPGNSAGDLVLHGNYPYCNLFEGNIVQNIVIDDSHGSNGSGNTFFRNRAELYGIVMNNNPPSPGQLFIGNEITSTLPFTGFYLLQGGGHFEFGNNVKGMQIPAGTNQLTYESLYLNQTPAFFQPFQLEPGNIGLPNTLNTGSNPARQRYSSNEWTVCEIEEVMTGAGEQILENEWRVFPNPSTGILNFENIGDEVVPSRIVVTDLPGKMLFEKTVTNRGTLDLSHLRPGIYFLKIQSKGRSSSKKILLTNH